MDNSNTDWRHLEDQGWASMSITLDKELPVKKKRRTIFLWLFFLAVLSLSIVYYLNSTQAASIKEQNIADKTDPIDLQEQNSNVSNKQEPLVKTTNEEQNTEEPLVKNEPTIKPIASQSKTSSNYKSIIQVIKDVVNVEQPSSSSTTLIQLADNPNLETEELVIEATKAVSLVSINALERLIFKPSFQEPNESNVLPSFAEIKSEPVKTRLSRISTGLGLSSSWTIDGFFRGLGGTAQIEASLNRKLYLHSAISYHRYSVLNQGEPAFAFDIPDGGTFEDMGPEVEGGGESNNQTANEEDLQRSINFNEFSTLGLDLGLGIHLSKRLNIWAGANLKHYFSFPQPSQDELINISTFGSELVTNSLQLNPKLGINYSILERLQVGLSYEYGMKHIYEDTNQLFSLNPISFVNADFIFRF